MFKGWLEEQLLQLITVHSTVPTQAAAGFHTTLRLQKMGGFDCDDGKSVC